jgi:hypothetical protein
MRRGARYEVGPRISSFIHGDDAGDGRFDAEKSQFTRASFTDCVQVPCGLVACHGIPSYKDVCANSPSLAQLLLGIGSYFTEEFEGMLGDRR